MLGYLSRRLFYAGLSVLAVSVAVFVITHLIGDPVQVMLPLEASQEQRDRLRQALGFNDPLPVQLARFGFDVLRGDFGDSLWQRVPAMPLVVNRLPATFLLAFVAMGLAVVIAIPLGVLAALRPRSVLDHACTLGSLLGMGRITQIVRSSTLDELNRNYVVAARARGLTEQAVILGHALKNAAIPIVTLGASSTSWPGRWWWC